MDTKKTIFIGSDHGGFILKKYLIQQLNIYYNHHIIDLGCFSEDSVDYPDIAHNLANQIQDNTNQLGILICGTGIGISIVANRYQHIRCGLCNDIEMAEMTRKHNNANCLALGGRKITNEDGYSIVKTFLETPFEGGRNLNRINKINRNY